MSETKMGEHQQTVQADIDVEEKKYFLDNFGRRSGQERRTKTTIGMPVERRILKDRRKNTEDRRKNIIGRIQLSSDERRIAGDNPGGTGTGNNRQNEE